MQTVYFIRGGYSAGARKINLGQIATASGPHYAIKVKIYEAKEKKPNICRPNIWMPLTLRTPHPLSITSYCSRDRLAGLPVMSQRVL